jgi:hydroxymethylglutaryl-CoA reductase
MGPSSRLSGFYQKSVDERVALLAAWAALDAGELALLRDGLSMVQGDKMIENVVGRFCLPLGIATNFKINEIDRLVPVVIEEPSVVAAMSFAARLARRGGGFFAGSTEPVMVGQVQLLDVPDAVAATARILAAQDDLLALADTSPTIKRLGGGPRAIQVRSLPETPTGPMLVIHLLVDVRDAMGANAINTAAEAIAPLLESLSGGRALLRILSNYSAERRAWAEVLIPADAFSSEDFAGDAVIANIAHANAFAVADPYRAATHNKGIFNGIDAVAMATGNDWRALEAGGHAWAARNGQYRALTEWRIVNDPASDFTADFATDPQPAARGEKGIQTAQAAAWHNVARPALYGRLELPLAVGTVGGATRALPMAQVALKVLGVTDARQLAEVLAAVGLAQNLAALRALATEGIQRGHMSLHARQIALAAGAQGDQVDRIAARLALDGQVRLEYARRLLDAERAHAIGLSQSEGE